MSGPYRCLLCSPDSGPYPSYQDAAGHARRAHPRFCEAHEVAEALAPVYGERPLTPAERRAKAPYYCQYCRDTLLTEAGVGQHVKAKHEIVEPEYGRDYLSDVDQTETDELRMLENELAIEAFARRLDAVDSVTDFLVDCGDAVPPVGWPNA